MHKANSLVVLDFETTGLSPDNGDRAIEIGAVRLVGGVITDRFQELMNPGRRVDAFIEGYTGITNRMLKDAAPCSEVMQRFADFVGDDNMLAHNASFDKRFLDSELNRISRRYSGEFMCSLLAARRIYQEAPNHKLATLVDYVGLAVEGDFHRALYDAEMTAQVWVALLASMTDEYALANVSVSLIQSLNKTQKKSVHQFLSRYSS